MEKKEKENLDNIFSAVDEIVNNWLQKNSYKINKVQTDKLREICCSIIEQRGLNLDTEEWSRKIDINDSIEYVYRFIQSIDKDMANQYMNIVTQVIDGKKTTIVLPRSEYPDKEKYIDCVLPQGNVYIYYTETPQDMFTIFHEMLHKLNHSSYNGASQESYTRLYFGESVSITGEMLLGKWLVDQGIITDNDFKLVKQSRIISTKNAARAVLLENDLIKTALSGEKISIDTLKKLRDAAPKDSTINYFYNIEIEHLIYTNGIKERGELAFESAQAYVLGQYLSKKIAKKENGATEFLKLNKEIGDAYPSLSKVTREADDYVI